jgi:hypothetical protein
LDGDRQVPASKELFFECHQLRPHPLCNSHTPEPKTTVPRLPTKVREAKEVECLRFPESPLRPVPGRKMPELDEAGLFGVQLQVKLRKSSQFLASFDWRVLKQCPLVIGKDT